VQRARRLEVAELHPRRIRNSRIGGEFRAVDDVAAIRRQRDIALRLGIRRTRLGELPGHPPHLHHPHPGPPAPHPPHPPQPPSPPPGRRRRSAPPPSETARGSCRG